MKQLEQDGLQGITMKLMLKSIMFTVVEIIWVQVMRVDQGLDLENLKRVPLQISATCSTRAKVRFFQLYSVMEEAIKMVV